MSAIQDDINTSVLKKIVFFGSVFHTYSFSTQNSLHITFKRIDENCPLITNS